MSPILSSQAVALATAMAISGTVILFALCCQKTTSTTTSVFVDQDSKSSSQILRSCISSGKKKEKKKKRVHFAHNVIDPMTNGEEFRKRYNKPLKNNQIDRSKSGGGTKYMPGNHMALYNGILRNRFQWMGLVHRREFSIHQSNFS